jgi:hypothetical protein
MKKSDQRPVSLDEPALYRIKVRGRLNEKWSDYFEGMAITVEHHDSAAAVTTLTGIVSDQSTLFGVLKQIRDLGLPLLLVEHIEAE